MWCQREDGGGGGRCEEMRLQNFTTIVPIWIRFLLDDSRFVDFLVFFLCYTIIKPYHDVGADFRFETSGFRS